MANFFTSQISMLAPVVAFAGRFDIDSEEEIPEIRCHPARAYVVTDQKRTITNAIALVCDPDNPPRRQVIEMLINRTTRELIEVHEFGTIYWPPLKCECPVIITERLGLPSLDEYMKENGRILDDGMLRSQIIMPAVRLLRHFRELGYSYRAFRLDNVFWNRGSGEEAIFGQCFASQPAMAQSVATETIECGLALPCARGNGGSPEDIYSLAMLVLGCLIGFEPWKGVPEEEVLQLKMREGSLNAVQSLYAIPAQYLDFFRGAMNDDSSERWTLKEVENWLDGRMQQQKPITVARKARRPLNILGEKCATVPEVAYLLARKWDDALPYSDGKEIEEWIAAELADGPLLQRLADAKSQQKRAPSADVALAKLLLILYPEGPIRYKWLSTTLQGIPNFGTLYYDNPEAMSFLRAIEQNQIVDLYLEQRGSLLSREQNRFMDEYRNMRSYLFSEEFGGGFLRFVYELNLDAPCRSPRVKGKFINNTNRLMPALDEWAKDQRSVYSFFDDSIMSYLLVHNPRLLGSFGRKLQALRSQKVSLANLSKNARLQIAMCELQILAQMQIKENPGTLFKNICKFVAKNVEYSVNNFFSRSLRQHVIKELKQLPKRGNVQHIHDSISNIQRQNEDQRAYARACEVFALNTKNLNGLNLDIMNRTKLAAVTGGQISSMMVAILSVIAASIVIVTRAF